jgi:hypothetical protein
LASSSVTITKKKKEADLESHDVSNALKVQVFVVEERQLWFKCFKEVWRRFQVRFVNDELLHSCISVLKRLGLVVNLGPGMALTQRT